MSVDNHKQEYHLTLQGWVYGSSWFYDKLQGAEIVRPNTAVETWLRHETQSSSYSAPDVSWKKLWSDPNISPDAIRELLETYPRPKR